MLAGHAREVGRVVGVAVEARAAARARARCRAVPRRSSPRTRGRGCSRRPGCGTRCGTTSPRGRRRGSRTCGCRAPRERGRRPRLGLVALVRVDGRREHPRELAAAARGRRPASRGTPATGAPGPTASHISGVVAVGVPHARVDVARRPGVVHRVLRHERDRPTVQPRDLLRAVLVDGVTVGHLHRVGVLEVDLVLAAARFSLRELDGDPRRRRCRCGSRG